LREKREEKKKKKKSFYCGGGLTKIFYFFLAPGNDLLRECSLKKNDATLWASQVRSIKSKKRSVAAAEHFGGDEDAMDSFLHQFHVDEHGRKRAVRMGRYSKTTVNGAVVEELRNWNEPKETGSGAKSPCRCSPSTARVRLAARLAVQGRPRLRPHRRRLRPRQAGTKCAGAPTSGKWACLIERGEVTFVEKVATCVAQGASGLIMFNKVVLKDDGSEDDPEFSASLGDERARAAGALRQALRRSAIKSTLLGKQATLEVPPEQASTAFLPLTNAVDQGRAARATLFASMAVDSNVGESADLGGSRIARRDVWPAAPDVARHDHDGALLPSDAARCTDEGSGRSLRLLQRRDARRHRRAARGEDGEHPPVVCVLD
jgi:hypothetical protein